MTVPQLMGPFVPISNLKPLEGSPRRGDVEGRRAFANALRSASRSSSTPLAPCSLASNADENWTTQEIADFVGQSLRQVYRILARPRGSGEYGSVLKIGLVSLLVDDYDEAIDFFVNRVGFRLIEDRPLEGDKRWVVVAPSDPGGTSLLLNRASKPGQKERIGNQAGGRVFLFLYTDNFTSEYERMQASGIAFVEPPRSEAYGTVAVFADLYGNRWNLIEPRS